MTQDRLYYGDKWIFSRGDVRAADFSKLLSHGVVEVKLNFCEATETVHDFAALELVWTLKPSALEGKRFRWYKHAWAFHNLIAHPVMQLLAWCGLYTQAMWVHDATTPRPRPTE